MARLGTINEYVKEKDKNQTTAAGGSNVSPSPSSVNTPLQPVNPATSPANVAGNSVNNSIGYDNAQQLKESVIPAVRSSDIQALSEEDALKQGNISPREYWSEQYKNNPNNSYALLAQQLATDETPDEKAKREKSERLNQVIGNIGDVIGSAANLYYTTKGAPYMDFTTSQQNENERIKQIRDKREALQRQRDAMLFNARLGDVQYDRSLQSARERYLAAKADKDASRQWDATKFATQMAYNQNRDAASNALRKEQISNSASHNKVMESIAGQNALTNKQRADAYVKQANDKSKSDKNNDYLPLGDNLVPVPKAQSKALYSKLYQIMKRDPQIQGSGVENIQLQFGEGGDQDTKMMNVVRRRLNDSPAAVQALQDYIGTPAPERTQTYSPMVNAPWVPKSTNNKAPWVK